MAKKIDVKVRMDCAQCKTNVLKAVAKLQGIDRVALDEEKGVLSLVGTVDPVKVIWRLRKKRMAAEIITVGPYKKIHKFDFPTMDA